MKQLTIFVLTVFVIACGSAPTAPTPTAPNITGQWSGTYAVGSCIENALGFCSALGSGGGLIFTPNQSGTTLTGTAGIGGFNIPVSGSVNSDAVVVLAGSGPIAAGATLTLNSWRMIVTGSTMAGTMAFNVTLLPNTVQVTATATLAKQ